MTPDEIKRLIAEATPGPWMVGPVDDTVVSGADGSEIAAIDGDYNEPDLWPIMEANARLIAAAPDLATQVVRLTEALKNVMGIVDTPIGWRRLGVDVNNCEWLEEARAALGERK